MDRYSITERSPLPSEPPVPEPESVTALPALIEPLRFSVENAGKSLTEMALRDLGAALQLLAERAQYITGASGAAIALRDQQNMICCASAGASAPPLGTHLQADSGLSGESVRTRQILRCDDAGTDSRVNRETCRALGIASVVVMPLLRDGEVVGVFELFSGKAHAFEERDITALQRLAEMIQTALEFAEAARKTEKEISVGRQAVAQAEVSEPAVQADAASSSAAEPAPEKPSTSEPLAFEPPAEEAASTTSAAATPAQPAAETPAVSIPVLLVQQEQASDVKPEIKSLAFELSIQPPLASGERGNIRMCEACGFPVSAGRTLCLDCEAAKGEKATPGAMPAEFLAPYSEEKERGWLSTHKYLLIVPLVTLLVLALIVWLR